MKKVNYKFYKESDNCEYNCFEEEILKSYDDDKISKDDYINYISEVRKNIINWYPFSEKSSILEIGNDMGNIVSVLCEKCNDVVVVECSKQRAEDIVQYNSKYNNLEVYCGNPMNINFSKKFDYIFLNGMFELSKRFCKSENSCVDFIDFLKKFLNKNGKILITTENKFGIKYLAGSSDINFNKPFSTLCGCDSDSDFKPFGKVEMDNIFSCLNFKSVKYYYPYPDYKFPEIIFSDNRLPRYSEIKKISDFNYYNDILSFSITDAFKGIIENNKFDFFSNSYLVELGVEENISCKIDYVKFQNNRNYEYQTITTISGDKVYKYPRNNLSKNHMLKMINTHKILNNGGINSVVINDDYSQDFINNKTIMEYIENIYYLHKYDKIFDEIDKFFSYLKSVSFLSEVNNPFVDEIKNLGNKIYTLPLGLFDLHFDNVIKKDNDYIIIDQEWSTDKQLPIEYNMYISLNVLYDKFGELNKFKSIYELYEKYSITTTMIDVFETCRNKFFYVENDLFNNINFKNSCDSNIDCYMLLEEYKNKNTELENKMNALKDKNDKISKELTEIKVDNEKFILQIQDNENVISDLNLEVDDYKKIISTNKDLIINLENENKILLDKLTYYSSEVYKILGSKSWILTSPIRKVSGMKYKIPNLKNKIKKISVRLFRNIYKYFPLPLKVKQKMLNFLCNKFKIVKRLRYNRFNYPEPMNISLSAATYNFGNELLILDKKVAIHAHVYYIDLLDEFYNYLNNVPYSFDVFVSVPKDEYIKIVKDKFKNLNNVNKIIVEKCQNVGRDFSPMFAQFGERISKYDYVCHIHTKKSVRTGTEQDGWRNHLIGSVLGSKEIISNIFYQFETNKNIGMIYPETYSDMPYWAHTFLKNRPMCDELARKFGIGLSDEYFDYSVGSVFWARCDALKKVFDLNLKYSDFGTEEGKNDGTFAHAIERMLIYCIISSGYKYLVIDKNDKCFREKGKKNLWQYCCQNPEYVYSKMIEHDVVTFDIFDTLITRKVYDPNDLFDIICEYINKNGYKIPEFKSIRLDAEFNIRKRKNFKSDVSIDEIYEEFSKIAKISLDDAKKIENIEKEFEIKFCIPREEMLKIYNKLLNAKKRIILISDMYLDSDTIKAMLNSCGYTNWSELLISCEVGKRKDNGTMWDYFFERENNTIHCGDNEAHDIQSVCDRNHDFIHVMQGKKIFKLTDYGNFLLNENLELSNTDNIILGLLINKVQFNNPFRNDFSIVVSNYKDYGYAFLGPLFIKFFLWLDYTSRKNKNDKLLFLAREGYYFKMLYDDFCSFKKIKPIDNEYFLASRRSVSIASINDINDVSELLDKYYSGNIKNLFHSRLGYDIEIEDFEINLPNDKDKVLQIFDTIKDDYFKKIKVEKNAYKKYVISCTKDYKNVSVVDLGYSGTIQYYLSKLMDCKYSGYYFITDKVVHPKKIGCDVYSCFNVDNSNNYEDKVLYYSLILEAFLTAPYGQLINFVGGHPNYKDDVISNSEQEILNQIYDGIKEFMRDLIELNSDISYYDISNKLICKNFASLVLVDGILPSEIEKNFSLEDNYCSDAVLSVFSILKSRR